MPANGFQNGRYDESPLLIFNVNEGAAAESVVMDENFNRSGTNQNFQKYGFPNQIQVRNNSTNRLILTVNDDPNKTFQVPPLLFETFNFEEEEIKRLTLENVEEFDTDALIQILVQKSITQNMVNRLMFEALTRGRLL